MSIETTEVRNSRAAIRKVLQHGGGCYAQKDGIDRVLSHNHFLDKPLKKLPWPISIFSEHNCRYVERKGSENLIDRKFSKRQINQAINLFLHDLSPDETIVIMPRTELTESEQKLKGWFEDQDNQRKS